MFENYQKPMVNNLDLNGVIDLMEKIISILYNY